MGFKTLLSNFAQPWAFFDPKAPQKKGGKNPVPHRDRKEHNGVAQRFSLTRS
jgi:hypothetical protein